MKITKTHKFENDIRSLARHYNDLVSRYADSAAGAQWSDEETQHKRFRILSQVGDISCSKILDFGCNTGALLPFIRSAIEFKGEYVGYDISQVAVDLAKKRFADGRFEVRDILANGIDEEFDYVLASGLFNNVLSDNHSFVTEILTRLFEKARTGMAFNALSANVDYRHPNLAYYQPEELFRFCTQRLSRRVALRHDYLIKQDVIPYEFTIYIYRAEREMPQNLPVKADG